MNQHNAAESIAVQLDRPIAYHRAFVSFGAGVTGAVMLSQAIYWSRRCSDEAGWFYKTMEQWEGETGLTRREQETARKKLIQCGVLVYERRGVPARGYYRVDLEAVQTRLAESAKLDCTNPPNSIGGKRQTITETTAETTAETKKQPPFIPPGGNGGDADSEKQQRQKPPSGMPADEVPPWLPEDAWRDFVMYRRERKKPLTPTATKRLIMKLTQMKNDGMDIAAALSQSMENGWIGVFEPRQEISQEKPQEDIWAGTI